MAKKTKIKIDHPGMRSVIGSEAVSSEVRKLAQTVKGNVGTPTASGEPMEVAIDYDRPSINGASRQAARIIIKHPAAMAVEAKRAPLSRAARAAGLKVAHK